MKQLKKIMQKRSFWSSTTKEGDRIHLCEIWRGIGRFLVGMGFKYAFKATGFFFHPNTNICVYLHKGDDC